METAGKRPGCPSRRQTARRPRSTGACRAGAARCATVSPGASRILASRPRADHHASRRARKPPAANRTNAPTSQGRRSLLPMRSKMRKAPATASGTFGAAITSELARSRRLSRPWPAMVVISMVVLMGADTGCAACAGWASGVVTCGALAPLTLGTSWLLTKARPASSLGTSMMTRIGGAAGCRGNGSGRRKGRGQRGLRQRHAWREVHPSRENDQHQAQYQRGATGREAKCQAKGHEFRVPKGCRQSPCATSQAEAVAPARGEVSSR